MKLDLLAFRVPPARPIDSNDSLTTQGTHGVVTVSERTDREQIGAEPIVTN
jgi:hypothetical protein